MSNDTVPSSSTSVAGNTTIETPDEAAEAVDQIAVKAASAAGRRLEQG